jgi:hypothetical protein
MLLGIEAYAADGTDDETGYKNYYGKDDDRFFFHGHLRCADSTLIVCIRNFNRESPFFLPELSAIIRDHVIHSGPPSPFRPFEGDKQGHGA